MQSAYIIKLRAYTDSIVLGMWRIITGARSGQVEMANAVAFTCGQMAGPYSNTKAASRRPLSDIHQSSRVSRILHPAVCAERRQSARTPVDTRSQHARHWFSSH